jgi:Txe/YoeB family toxin of toxin-antitoxin system
LGISSEQDARTARISPLLILRFKCRTAYPFTGTGKPERLKYQDANIWSRRLTQADRIVYMVSDDRIDFLQARYHYSDRG